MKIMVLAVVSAAFSCVLPPAAVCAQSPLADVAQSHIDGNVPAPANFDKLLRRDLTAYFQGQMGRKAGKVSVVYDLLRKGATQTGVSSPKFYLWVTIRRKGKVLEEGAARVAAIERKQFEVLGFLSRAQLRKDPDAAALVFPAALLDKIRRYVSGVRS